MSETPIFSMPETGLTDYQIENPLESRKEQHDFNLWEEEVAGPPIFAIPERDHEVVAAPVASYETLSHAEMLQRGIEHAPDAELVRDVMQVTQNVDAARRYALAA